MPDDLTARCTALVREVLRDLAVQTRGESAVHGYQCVPIDAAAVRLGRMMAAYGDACYKYGRLNTGDTVTALVAAAREGEG